MKVVATRRACATAVPALVLLLALAPATPAATPAPKPVSTAKPAAKPATVHPSPALPDSVLAKVTTGTSPRQEHLVLQRQLIAAMARGGLRMDSVTPQDRREFLGVLVDQVVLVARVKQEPRRWDHRDSTDWNTLRDRLVLRAALDSAMTRLAAERASRGDSLLGPQELGILLRDTFVREMAPKWNDPALRKAVSVFDTLPRPNANMSMLEQMRVAGVKPTVNEADGALVLAQSSEGEYTLGELVRDFGRLNPIYRPRISRVEDVKDLVGNALFESRLRRMGTEQGLEHKPSVARQLDERAEYLDVSKFVAREVYARIAQDSVTLQRHYAATKSQYDWDERASIISLVAASWGEADSIRKVLLKAADAESLAVRSTRAGASFRTTITRMSDTTLFDRLKRGGVGTVLGPDSTSQGWRAMRVTSFEPRRSRSYAEAEPLVKQNWYNAEGERRMRALLDDLRKQAHVVINEKAMSAPLPATTVNVKVMP